ncbi:MAG TPA: cyclic nucleotide-binding domain-containing protein [Burkholderiales bacterium]|nr:cyclic nucleotide-binding domain-containing protein [Burkholderiales bacterium]
MPRSRAVSPAPMIAFSQRLLDLAHALRFPPGARLVRQGEASRGAFLVRSGRVAAQVALPGGGMLGVAELGEGDVFGEMALIERGVCSATVVALTDVEALFIEREEFRAMVASRDPAALDTQRAITRVLAAKLRALNAKLREHPAEEDRPAQEAPHVPLLDARPPGFDWRGFLPVLRFFEGFDERDIAELLSIARAMELQRGTWIFAAGQPADRCFVVVRGAIEVLSRLGGLERRVTLAGPGELVGYLAVLDRASHAASARVRETAALLEFPGEAFTAAYEGESRLAVKLQHAIHRSLLRSLARTNNQLSRLISAARLRGAEAEGRALEKARGSQVVDLVQQPD